MKNTPTKLRCLLKLSTLNISNNRIWTMSLLSYTMHTMLKVNEQGHFYRKTSFSAVSMSWFQQQSISQWSRYCGDTLLQFESIMQLFCIFVFAVVLHHKLHHHTWIVKVKIALVNSAESSFSGEGLWHSLRNNTFIQVCEWDRWEGWSPLIAVSVGHKYQFTVQCCVCNTS